MNIPKAINLRVRPLQSVDLSFPCDGIIGAQADIHLLGKAVKAFDLATAYGLLGTVLSPRVWKAGHTASGRVTPGEWVTLPTSDQPLGWGRLQYNSTAIREYMKDSILFELRAEQVKAALDKSILLRENIWAQKFERSVYEATQQAYSRDNVKSKLNRLNDLAWLSALQHDKLNYAYATDFGPAGDKNVNSGVVKAGLSTTTTTPATQGVTTVLRGLDYRMPGIENDAQYHRAHISLLDEQIATESATNYAYGSKVERDSTVDPYQINDLSVRHFKNDLGAIDLDVKRLQVAYMDTLLVSPIDGVVTGVYRNIGDSVRAAQPVVRVENDSEIFLVGTLKYRGLLQVGQSISVATNIFDTADTRTASGNVAAVRGHDSENELWDLLILCGNRDAANRPLFPINYNFDFESTTVNITT